MPSPREDWVRAGSIKLNPELTRKPQPIIRKGRVLEFNCLETWGHVSLGGLGQCSLNFPSFLALV